MSRREKSYWSQTVCNWTELSWFGVRSDPDERLRWSCGEFTITPVDGRSVQCYCALYVTLSAKTQLKPLFCILHMVKNMYIYAFIQSDLHLHLVSVYKNILWLLYFYISVILTEYENEYCDLISRCWDSSQVSHRQGHIYKVFHQNPDDGLICLREIWSLRLSFKSAPLPPALHKASLVYLCPAWQRQGLGPED